MNSTYRFSTVYKLISFLIYRYDFKPVYNYQITYPVDNKVCIRKIQAYDYLDVRRKRAPFLNSTIKKTN